MNRPPYAMVFAELAQAAGLTPGIITVQGQALLPLHPEHLIWRGRLSRKGGWRMLPGGVKCARPGWFGNPFKVGPDGDALACVDKYRHALWEMRFRNADSVPTVPAPGVSSYLTAYLAPLVVRHGLRGYIVLYCWCKLGDPCHCTPLADALAKELERIVK